MASSEWLSHGESSESFKWAGNIENLMKFCEETVGAGDHNWSRKDGHNGDPYNCKIGEDVNIRWFPTTHTLQIRGKQAETLKLKLTKIILEQQEDANISHVVQISRHDDQTIAANANDPSNSGTISHCCCDKMTNEVADIRAEIAAIKQQQTRKTSDLEELRCLREELADKQGTNVELERRLHDIEQEARVLREENQSLITALRLLNSDSTSPRNCTTSTTERKPTQASAFQLQQKKPSKKTEKKKSQNTQQTKVQVPTENRYEVLQVDLTREETPKSVEPQTTTVVIGDSMIKRVQGWKIGKKVGHRVVVKAFPGASTADMKHYLKPTLSKNPQRIVLHVGTNDLHGKMKPTPNQIADSIIDLARMVENESDAEVMVSEIVTRSDKTPEDHIKAVNKLLNKYCNQNGWGLIRHNKITKTHLNEGGLHLNDQGVSILVSNLVKSLSE